MPTDHLKPHQFLPGQSGNPSGRPKNLPVTTILREQMERPVPTAMLEKLPPLFLELYPQPTFAEMMAFQLIAQSAKGDILAFKELLERVEGKVVQKAELVAEVNGNLASRLKEARKNAERARD